MTRLAGDLHRASNDPKVKKEIRDQISAMAVGSRDPLLARAAALVFSRMGYGPDSLSVFAAAKRFVEDDDYYGELAHMLPDITSGTEQATVLQLIGDSKNRHAREILISQMLASQVVEGLTPSAARQVVAIMANNPPAFTSVGPNLLGGFEMLAYNDWLIANTRLAGKLTKEPTKAVVARLVDVDKTDVRALIALLQAEPTAGMVREAFNKTSLAKIDSRIAAWASSSSNAWVKDVSGQARANLVGP